MPAAYQDSVFLNVPFDRKYGRLFDALVFAVHDCGFIARSALEVDDSGQARVLKILDIIDTETSAPTSRARIFGRTATTLAMRSAPPATG